MSTTDELLAKARKPGEDAMRLHPFYRGKTEVVPKCAVRDVNDFSIWYTPGVAEPCKAIKADKEAVYEYTNKWNTIAVVSDGTRVLGLGDIGPEAGMPVMEGKALLFKYLGGVDAVPICLDTKDPANIISAVRWLQPSFGGINLEDIAQPKCFEILDTLRAQMDIPVWHDDQQGTATVLLAGLINALKVVDKSMRDVKLAMIGAGAANIAITRLLFSAGVTPGNTIIVDSKGTLHPGRDDIAARQHEFVDKWRFCQITNADRVIGGIAEAMKGADVCIALSKAGPDTIKKEWVASMAKDAILFACANPVPEIWPWDAKEAGARIVATGRSDFPNQLNNSLGFPGIFRGTLDVRAKTITDEMCIAAATELAKCAEERGLSEDFLAPTMDDWEVFPREAAAVGVMAQEQGIARIQASREELYQQAARMIKRARDLTQTMMKEGYIPAPPGD
ncbi:MAG: NADP-dependent malic enzyme [Chloroflexi bacterium]|nr:NADP-dependent malic enzyme [Chloroflexota bacterium]MDA8188364.1 NADP-dependent malic enzyme [Dehalococcoidales bacterium]